MLAYPDTHFSWSSVAIAAVSAGLSEGFDLNAQSAKAASVNGSSWEGFNIDFLRAAGRNVINQGVRMAVTGHGKMDWVNVAADGFGSALINAWMASEGVNAQDIISLDRLAYMAARGFGTLEFRPARGPRTRKSTAIDLATLVESARRAVHGEIDSDAHVKAALTQIIQLGTSAGGAGAKAAVALNSETLELRAGQFDVTSLRTLAAEVRRHGQGSRTR